MNVTPTPNPAPGSVQQLSQEAFQLRRQLNALSPTDPEWLRVHKRLQQVSGDLVDTRIAISFAFRG